MDVLPNTVYAREAFLPMSFCAADFATNYVPFATADLTPKPHHCRETGSALPHPFARQPDMTTALVSSAFVAGVDRVIEAHDAWEKDEQQPGSKPPQTLLDACEELFDITHGSDIRGFERKLFAAVTAFESAFRGYDSGSVMQRNGEPAQAFWTALANVFHERRIMAEMKVRNVESVATLRKQKVSDFQIANHIYGHRGKGPFLEEGRLRSDLIDKEEKEPGSVVPADWVPEAEIERLRDQHIKIGAAVQPNAKDRHGQPTVEGMLRDGATVDQISMACEVSAKQVHLIAQALNIPIHIPIQSERPDEAIVASR